MSDTLDAMALAAKAIKRAQDKQSHGDPAPKSSTKPELIVSDSDPTATAKDLATVIAKRNDFLFNGHAPVHIAAEAGGMPRALEVTIETVRVLAHEICDPVKLRKVKEVIEKIPTSITRDVAALYLYGLQGQWGLKPFRGITTAPILKNDGSIHPASGYDAETALWCHQVPFLTIPEIPTKEDAAAALLRLRRFFQTFPFADAERVVGSNGIAVIDLSKPAGLDESTFITAVMTSVTRQSIDLAPAVLCDAPSLSGAGTGKGLLVKAACIIGSGVRPSAFTSGHDAGELDKRLTAALTQAHPAVFLDNFNSKELKSDTLASVLTESPAMVRPMGHTKTVPLHGRTFIGITGNGVEIAEDMARRVLKVSLDAKMEDPEQRKFAPGFLDHVLASRHTLLSDALTIWRWGRHTDLKHGKPLGSYELWAQWCRDPLLALGMRDPVDRIAEIKAADPRRRAAVEFFDVWWAVHADTIVKASEVAAEVIQHIDENARRKEDGDLKFSRQRVARVLKSYAGTRLSGYVFTQLKDPTRTRSIAQYKLQLEKEELA